MVGLASGLAQEQFEELFFDGGLEAADEGDGCGGQGAGEVVALEDEVAGAMDGAEEGDGFAVEEGGVAYEGDGGFGCGVGDAAQGCRGVGRAGFMTYDLHENASGMGVGRLYDHEFNEREDRFGG